ncbi:type III-A CRISPR-associated RAMP protein Csm3 [bacterium]|nr:type III-A CRISPR-associated RAMP protein Csm3 [bacterium]
MERPILGKVIIEGNMRCLTGLHIGARREAMKIGGIDLPVVRDPITEFPYVPGSSLKGKMRSLLERRLGKEFNANVGGVRIHSCTEKNCEICRLFGSTPMGGEGENIPSRLAVRDLPLTEDSKEKLSEIETGLLYTEWKFENAIDRVTSAANPRQIERVPAGSVFQLEIVYTVENEAQLKEDLGNLLSAMRLLEDDYLGGHGSRGYGKVKFELSKIEYRKGEWYLTSKDEHRKEWKVSSIDEAISKIQEIAGF